MKILIIEDNNAKVERIIDRIMAVNGTNRDDIEVAYTVSDGVEHLRSTNFDLLILDSLVPRRAGETATAESTVTLLTELRERATLRKPGHIIGLTAYDEGFRALQPIFAQQMWTIVRYSESSNDWSDQLAAAITWISQTKSAPLELAYRNDVCMVAALMTPEFDALLRNGWDWSSAEPLDDTMFVHRGRFSSGGREFTALAAACSKMGMISAALLASKLIQLERPKYIAMVGICAGVKGRTNYGDPVIADPCWDWQSGKHVAKDGESAFEIRPEQLPLDQTLRARWEQLKADKQYWTDLKARWTNAPDTDLRLRMGPAVSGSSVLADEHVLNDIKRQHGGLTALEMEAYGVISAAFVASKPKPIAFSCKSVCDFADESKDDRWQAYAAYTSAMATTEFFNRYMHEISG